MSSETKLENFWNWTMKKLNIIWYAERSEVEKLNSGQKCSILGPQNLGSTTSFITISCEEMMKINARKYIVMQNHGFKFDSTIHKDWNQ